MRESDRDWVYHVCVCERNGNVCVRKKDGEREGAEVVGEGGEGGKDQRERAEGERRRTEEGLWSM